MGRPVLYLREINAMLTAEDVAYAVHSRKASDNWGEWENKNPKLAKLLIEIETDNAASISE